MARTATFFMTGLLLLQLGPVGASETRSADKTSEQVKDPIEQKTTRLEKTEDCISEESWLKCYQKLYGSTAGGLPYPHDEPVYHGVWPYKKSGGLDQVND